MAKKEQVPIASDENQEKQIPKYSREELMAAAVVAFNVKPEVVMAALKVKGLSEATKAEAEAAIKEFSEKEVK
jgi:hypothetical protein